MSRMEQLPIDAFIASGVLFTLSVIILLINRFVKHYESLKLNLPLLFIATLFIWIYEYQIIENITFTFIFSMLIFIGSLFKDVTKILKEKNKFKVKVPLYLSVVFTYSNFRYYIDYLGLISIYFGLICFSLSIISIFSTTLMLIKPQKLFLRVLFKIIVFVVFIYIVVLYLPIVGGILW